ncbi:MAG: RidA family protein [Pseudomonadota bacterium]
MTTRQRTTSGSPFEDRFGFCRAVREGNRIIVAGTGPIDPDGQTTPGGAGPQAARCCELIIAAIEALGGRTKDVVRTRMFLTDFADQEAVGDVHNRYFGEAKPTATMAGVAWLCGEDWKVEIEAEALLPE